MGRHVPLDRRRSRAPSARSAALHRAVFESELLESRTLLAFAGHISAPSSGSLNSPFTIDLWTTGGSAKSWTVFWGDGSNTPYTAPSGGFLTPQPESHTYTSAPTSALHATATLSVSPFTVATATYGLSLRFGTESFQQSGQTDYTPYGESGVTGHPVMAVGGGGCSPNFLYVASQYGGNQFGITRFTAPGTTLGGVVDTSWGNFGTVVLPAFGGNAPGTTEVDTPTAISVDPDGNVLAVVGQAAITVTATRVTTYEWAVAQLETSNGSIDAQVTAGLPSSTTNRAVEATAVVVANDNPDERVVVAGTDGFNIIAAAFDESSASFDTTFGRPGTGIVTITPSSPGNTSVVSSGANTIIQSQNDDGFLIGGYTVYNGTFCAGCDSCCGGCCGGCDGCCGGCGIPYTASDFTLVRLDDNGLLETSFGTQGVVHTNFASEISVYGECGGCCGGCRIPFCNVPSSDSDYSLMEWDGSGTWQIIAVGSTKPFLDPTQWGLVRYNESNGSLDSHFGQYRTGVALPGIFGTPYSAALEGESTGGGITSATFDPNVGVIAAGSVSNNSHFATTRITNTTTGGGTIDHTFGDFATGIMYSDFGTGSTNTTDVPYSVVIITPSNSDIATDILVGGFTNNNGGQIALADYLTSNRPVIT